MNFTMYSDDDSDDEEDETAELLRELEKIKRERAEEKARIEKEQNADAEQAREVEIATANPLLNLAAALGQAPGVNTTAPGTFAVKRRWDDGMYRVSPVSCNATSLRTDDLLFYVRPNLQEPSNLRQANGPIRERPSTHRVPQVRVRLGFRRPCSP
jgi:hypothetical protein